MTQFELTNYLLMAKPKELNISGTEKTVFVHLSTFADGALQCFPSIKTLALVTGFSDSAIKRAIKKLEELQLIKKTRRYSSSGPTSNLYQLNTQPLKMGVNKQIETATKTRYLAEDGNYYDSPSEYYAIKLNAANREEKRINA